MTVDIIVHGKIRGHLYMAYMKECPQTEMPPLFLPEEKRLINVVTSRLGKVIEKKILEEALLESERRHRVLFESSPIGMFIDRRGVITHCNKSFLKIFHIERDKAIGSPVTNFVNDERLEKILLGVDADILPYYEKEYPARIAGKHMYLKSYYVPHKLMNNTFDSGICLIDDITKSKQSEEELQQQKELLTSTFNALQDLIVVVDRDMHVVTSNRVEDKDKEPDKLTQGACFERIAGYDKPCDPYSIKEVFSSGNVAEVEQIDTNTGKVKEYRAFPVFDKDSNIIMAVEHIRDITDRKNTEKALQMSKDELAKAYEELKSLDTLKDEFLSNLRHELNTPLTSIKGFSELLAEGTFGPLNQKQQDIVEKVVTKSKQLHSLIDSLLFASTSQGGKVQYLFEKMLVSEALMPALNELSGQAMEKDITINSALPSHPLFIKGDANYLPRALIYLLDNAIKFTPKHGKVKLSAYPEYGNIHIELEDNGIGIAKEDLPFVFNKFHQVDSSSTRSYGGNGLGLYITKLIVEDHGGQIWLESEKGVGTKVHVLLPAMK